MLKRKHESDARPDTSLCDPNTPEDKTHVQVDAKHAPKEKETSAETNSIFDPDCTCDWCRKRATADHPLSPTLMSAVNTKHKHGYLIGNAANPSDLATRYPNVVRIDRGHQSFFLHKDNEEDIRLVSSTVALTSHDIGRLAGYLTPVAEKSTHSVCVEWYIPNTSYFLFEEVVDLAQLQHLDDQTIMNYFTTKPFVAKVFNPNKKQDPDRFAYFTALGVQILVEMTLEKPETDWVPVKELDGLYQHPQESTETCYHYLLIRNCYNWKRLGMYLASH